MSPTWRTSHNTQYSQHKFVQFYEPLWRLDLLTSSVYPISLCEMLMGRRHSHRRHLVNPSTAPLHHSPPLYHRLFHLSLLSSHCFLLCHSAFTYLPPIWPRATSFIMPARLFTIRELLPRVELMPHCNIRMYCEAATMPHWLTKLIFFFHLMCVTATYFF